jgi:hypothetical protein
MDGCLGGAFGGAEALRPAWVRKAEAAVGAVYVGIVEQFVALLAKRRDEVRASVEFLDQALPTG